MRNRPSSRLVVGSAQFGMDYGIHNAGGKVSERATEAILEDALLAGVSQIDTAPAYGDAEEVLGRILKRRRSWEFKIITKTGAAGGALRQSVERSIDRLGGGKLYGVLAHLFHAVRENPRIAETLRELRAERLVEKIGFSLYSPEEYRWLVENGIDADIVQIPYNVLDRRFEPELDAMRAAGVEVHVRSVFLQGLFFVEPSELPPTLVRLAPRLERLREIGASYGVSLAECALQFALSDERVDRVIVGVDALEQWRENIRAAARPANPAMLAELSELSESDENLIVPTRWGISPV